MENTSTYEFEYASNDGPIIKVIGVGGGGSNAVNHMYEQGIQGVDFYICNTDVQALTISPVPNKIQIGADLTRGLGAGAKPEVGKSAALESKEQLRELLSDNTQMAFVTAGMGGGTGTGAAPVIAEIAKELGVLTVGIITMPFTFEGKPKKKRAELGIEELRKNCDTVLIILNNRLKDVYGSLSMKDAFRHADDVLATAAKSIAEIITVSGTINVDFEDVRTVMTDSGVAVMGSAIAEGDNRALKAAEGALTSPLLDDTDIFGAKYILLSIMVGDDDSFQFEELEEITDFVQDRAGEETEIIFGQAVDASLGQAIGVTVIATGFENEKKNKKRESVESSSKKGGKKVNSEKADEKNEPTKNVTLRNTTIELDYDDTLDFFDVTKDHDTTEATTQEKKSEKVVFRLDEDDYDTYESEEQRRQREREENYRYQQEQIDNFKSMGELSNEELQERKDIPAYMRKKVDLKDIPHTSDDTDTTHNIKKDNKVLGNNNFLYDNAE